MNNNINDTNNKTITKDVNQVTLQGLIVHKFDTPKAVILTISTGKEKKFFNYPKVVFFGDYAKAAAQFNVRDKVKIIGNIQSSKRRSDIKKQKTETIFGESIEAAPTLLKESFGLEGVYTEDENIFKLAGVIRGINMQNRSIVTITVKTEVNNRMSFVPVVLFTNRLRVGISELVPNTRVSVVGKVQTSSRGNGKEKEFFEDYVADDICII